MSDKITSEDVRISIGVSPLCDSKTAFEIERSPADHEFTSLSPVMLTSEIEKPVESIATIAFVALPTMPSTEPLTPERMLTAFPTPLANVSVSISAVPPTREIPVPV